MNLFVTAGSHGNPGPAAFAVVFERNGQQLTTTDVRYVGHHTANYATLAGLVFGLTEALARGADHVRVFSDLSLLVGVMSGKMKCGGPELQELVQQAKELAGRIGASSFLQSRIDPKLKKVVDKEIAKNRTISPFSAPQAACAEVAG